MNNGIQSVNELNNETGNQPVLIRLIAHFFSVLFHPLFVPLYVMFFLVYIHPSYFVGFDKQMKLGAFFITAINAVIFPLITVLLLKGLNFISSVYLHNQKDRIIPYIASGVFFFWTFWVFYNNENYSKLIPAFFLGMLLAVSIAVIINNYFKISMHAMGMGGWLALFILIMKSNTMLMTWPLAALIVLTGLVCTCRLIVSNHSTKDIVWGLLLGMVTQFAAAVFVK